MNNMNVVGTWLSILCCVASCLHQATVSQIPPTTSQPGFNQPTQNTSQAGFNRPTHTTSQLSFNQSQLRQSQHSQERFNQSEHSTSLRSQSGLNQSDQIQTQLNQSQSSPTETDQSGHSEGGHTQSEYSTSEPNLPTTSQTVQWQIDCKTLMPHVDLSYHNLSRLPATLFNPSCADKILVLDLTHNQLTDLDPGLLTLLTSLQEFKASHNQLTAVPGNALSHLKFLRVVDLSHNRIRLLPPLSLPASLVQLDLSFNHLTQLSDGLFCGLHYLQCLDLSHNQLREIQPHAFNARMESVTWANLSYNQLTDFEPWPYVLNKYITFDLRHNYISQFTNLMNVTVTHEIFGEVDLRYNNLTRFTRRDLTIYLNGTPITPMKFAVSFQLNIRQNPFICDCHLHWMLEFLKGDILRDNSEIYDYLTCASPPLLRGRPFGFFLSHGYLLVCEVLEGCPEGCRCMDTPHHGYLLVSCDPHLHTYTQLPAHLPSDGLVSLNLSGHALRQLEVGQCDVNRLKVLDVSGNQIRQVLPSFLDAAIHLEELDLRHNQLTSLPSALQRLSIDNLHLSNNPLICSCDLARFGLWVKAMVQNMSQTEAVTMTDQTNSQTPWKSGQADIELLNSNWSWTQHDHQTTTKQSAPRRPPPAVLLNCSLPDGRHVALVNTSQWGLDCQSHHINVYVLVWGGVLLAVVVVGVVICWRWRYNLRVLIHSTCHMLPSFLPKYHTANEDGDMRWSRDRTSPTKNHLYLSIDEKNDVIVTWVRQWLLPFLENMGRNSLHVYLPLRQEPVGVVQAESRAEAISTCPKFVAILTPGYSANGLCRQELDFACWQHQRRCHKNIIIIVKDDLMHQSFLQRPAVTTSSRTPHLGDTHEEGAVGHDDVVVDISDHTNNSDTEVNMDVTVEEKDDEEKEEEENREQQQSPHSSRNSCNATSEASAQEDTVRRSQAPRSQCINEILCALSLPNGTHQNGIALHAIRNGRVARAARHQPVSPRTAQQRPVSGRGVHQETSSHQSIEACPCNTHTARQSDPNPDLDQRTTETAKEQRSVRDYFSTKKRRKKREDSMRQLIKNYQNRTEEAEAHQNGRGEATCHQNGRGQATCHQNGRGQATCHQRRREANSQKKRIRKKRLKELSQYWEHGELNAVEPLRSFLLQGHYLSPSDWLFKHKLLFELSRK